MVWEQKQLPKHGACRTMGSYLVIRIRNAEVSAGPGPGGLGFPWVPMASCGFPFVAAHLWVPCRLASGSTAVASRGSPLPNIVFCLVFVRRCALLLFLQVFKSA